MVIGAKKGWKKRLLVGSAWVLGIYLVAAIVAGLMISQKRAGFVLTEPVVSEELSPYLTHGLVPQLWMGLQGQEPFELVIGEDAVNDIVARQEWPLGSDGVEFWCPTTRFVDGRIEVEGLVLFKGAKVLAKVSAEPKMEEDGRLGIRIKEVKAGALGITGVAKGIARKMIADEIGSLDEVDELSRKLIDTLLEDRSVEPTFEVFGRDVRILAVELGDGKLKAKLAAVGASAKK